MKSLGDENEIAAAAGMTRNIIDTRLFLISTFYYNMYLSLIYGYVIAEFSRLYTEHAAVCLSV